MMRFNNEWKWLAHHCFLTLNVCLNCEHIDWCVGVACYCESPSNRESLASILSVPSVCLVNAQINESAIWSINVLTVMGFWCTIHHKEVIEVEQMIRENICPRIQMFNYVRLINLLCNRLLGVSGPALKRQNMECVLLYSSSYLSNITQARVLLFISAWLRRYSYRMRLCFDKNAWCREEEWGKNTRSRVF